MNDTPQERALLAKMPEDQTYPDALEKLSGVHSKSAIAVLLIEERKAGYNDALEQVAKWMDGCCQRAKSFSDEAKAENDSEGIFAWRTDAMAHASRAAHVRSMKKP